MNWLNPINWFKKAAASAIDQKVDELVTIRNGKDVVVSGINKVIVMTDSVWCDEDCRKYARGMRLAGKALNDLAEAIDPDGEEGKKLSVDEFEVLMADSLAAFGTVIDESLAEKIRDTIKAFVRERLGV